MAADLSPQALHETMHVRDAILSMYRKAYAAGRASRQDELDTLRDALAHYANQDHWSEEPGDVYTTWSYDGGHALPWKVAHSALSPHKEAEDD